MRIRMRQPVSGTFEGIDGGVAIGQIVDVPDDRAERYINSGLAEKATGSTAALSSTATLSAQVETATTVRKTPAPPKKRT